MSNLSRDNRSVETFVREYAEAHDLTREQAARLQDRTSATMEWLKSFRRCMGYVRRYGMKHPTAQQQLMVLYDRTRKMLRAFGPLTLHFGPGESQTTEGFELPHAQGTDLESYTFFCLFRDGISSMTLKPGLLAGELGSLLEIVAARGRRDGDDAMTWLWAGRHEHIRIELEPTISPRVAAAMLARDDDDPLIEAFMMTLNAADPKRKLAIEEHVTRSEAPSFRPQGMDPRLVEHELGDGDMRPGLGTPSDHERAGFRAAYLDPEDRMARARHLNF